MQMEKYAYVKNFTSKDKQSTLDIDISIALPKDKKAYPEINAALKEAYFGRNSHADILDQLTDNASNILHDFRKIDADLSDENWQQKKSMAIIFSNDNYITFLITEYLYTGGAHGYTSHHYYTFDKTLKHTLHYTDLFKNGSCTALISMQQAVYKKERGEAPDEFFADGFKCKENFYITADGIVFHYDPYEIGPYSDGVFDIVLPLSDVESLLK